MKEKKASLNCSDKVSAALAPCGDSNESDSDLPLRDRVAMKHSSGNGLNQGNIVKDKRASGNYSVKVSPDMPPCIVLLRDILAMKHSDRKTSNQGKNIRKKKVSRNCSDKVSAALARCGDSNESDSDLPPRDRIAMKDSSGNGLNQGKNMIEKEASHHCSDKVSSDLAHYSESNESDNGLPLSDRIAMKHSGKKASIQRKKIKLGKSSYNCSGMLSPELAISKNSTESDRGLSLGDRLKMKRSSRDALNPKKKMKLDKASHYCSDMVFPDLAPSHDSSESDSEKPLRDRLAIKIISS